MLDYVSNRTHGWLMQSLLVYFVNFPREVTKMISFKQTGKKVIYEKNLNNQALHTLRISMTAF